MLCGMPIETETETSKWSKSVVCGLWSMLCGVVYGLWFMLPSAACAKRAEESSTRRSCICINTAMAGIVKITYLVTYTLQFKCRVTGHRSLVT